MKTPTVKVTFGNTLLKENTDYTVSYGKGRKNPGSYLVTVKLKGNYYGTNITPFTISPKPTTITSLKALANLIIVEWKKQAKQTSGYQLQYSLKKNFKNSKSVSIKNTKTLSRMITKLKVNKTYYVRIRTYKTVSGTKYYSSWSKAKSVKTK